MKEPLTLTIPEFGEILESVCAKDTAAGGGEDWTTENPTFGHGEVTALVVQDLFGGDLLRVSLEGTEFSKYRSHYFNRLPSGEIVDLTLAQFQGRLPKDLPIMEKDREYVIGGADTRERYKKLWERLANAY